jgi:histone H3/H4
VVERHVHASEQELPLEQRSVQRPPAKGLHARLPDRLNRQLGQNCNPVVSAEALMLLKEHIEENYGSIRYTLGLGAAAP